MGEEYETIFYEEIGESRKKALVHLLEIKKIKNPQNLERVGLNAFVHENSRGKKKRYHVFSNYNEYDEYIKTYESGKLYKCMSYYIVEENIE